MSSLQGGDVGGLLVTTLRRENKYRVRDDNIRVCCKCKLALLAELERVEIPDERIF